MKAERIGHTGITWPFTPDGAKQAIDDVASLGYRSVELFGFVLDKYPGGVEGVRADLERANLVLSAAYCSAPLIDPDTREQDVTRMRTWAEAVKSLGGDVIVVGAAPRQKPTYDAAEYAGLTTTLNEIGRRCNEIGIKACFHPHTGTPVETPEEITRVMDSVDPTLVFMAPDTGQIAKGGGDAVEVVRTYRSLVRHIHLKDYVGGESRADDSTNPVDRTGYLDYVPLGEGVVDFGSIVADLDANGYDGWWMVELDGTDRAPHPAKDAAAISRRHLDTLVSASN